MSDLIPGLIDQVSGENMREWLYWLADDPLPCRTLNYTRPGMEISTLHEADAYITQHLESWGYTTESEPCQVQAYRRDETKPLHLQYSTPAESDPWYTAYNLYARHEGTELPNEVIVVISHKDSQSWLDLGPGAHDNGVGTVANMEVARVLADYHPRRSIWHVWCNEEHTPWTSKVVAKRVADSGMRLVAALNADGIGGKATQEHGRMVNVTAYATPEGERLAELMEELNERYEIGLEQRKHERPRPNDDDGSFVLAGMPWAVIMIGSWPYADPKYHTCDDTPARIDFENQRRTTQLALATLLHLDAADDLE
jgi:hypothetical protein